MIIEATGLVLAQLSIIFDSEIRPEHRHTVGTRRRALISASMALDAARLHYEGRIKMGRDDPVEHVVPAK